MSQQEEASEKQGYCDDDTACTIKVESSDKVTKLFSAFKDFYAMTQKMEQMNKTEIESLMKRLCVLRKQNECLRDTKCKLGEQFKRWFDEASDHGDSPSYSSLNHSYKIRNMLDNGDTASVVAPNPEPDKNENIPRPPHSPAPPIPAPKYESKSRV